MAPELAAYFDAMGAALRSEIEPAEVEARCGPSSSTERLGLVLRMVQAGRRKLLCEIYAASRRAVGDALFEAAVRVHLLAEAGGEADYAAIALDFPRRLADAGAPAWALEVADWEESRHRLRVVGAPEVRGRLRGPTFVKCYGFDVPRWVRAAREDGPVDDPTPETALYVLHRDADDGPVRWFAPSAAHVAAIAEAMGDADEDALVASGVPRDALAAARVDLVERGVIAEAAA